MFKIKICGITNPEDAESAVNAGADAIGLNFYHRSPRVVSVDRAIEIVHEGNLIAQRVGVFVNTPVDEIHRIAKAVGLAWVQLHGDEPPGFLSKIDPQFDIIRVRRLDAGDDPTKIGEDIAACRAAGRAPDAVLVDARSTDEYGGTGDTVDWAGLGDHKIWLGDIPLILAGGLRPDNVDEAILTVRPAAVDTASGVEKAPGRKDKQKMQTFVDTAKEAFRDAARSGS
ncbi:phosphoribosylanthranilate isomerase [Adhaeretor mobilis]|uniref:phosphoribosylanthranilate isomerase n=1 Tax=Adhaeretor mobilis TaxID=1930276 RepID=UPI0011A68B70|nr:phosphoribosylanthranilate isomerase [Adhaeretor mobilis]